MRTSGGLHTILRLRRSRSYLLVEIEVAGIHPLTAAPEGSDPLTSLRHSLPRLILAATAILVFIHSWNEFVVALNLTARQTATVPVAIAKYAQENETRYGDMAAGALLLTLPALVLLFIAQRHLVRGLTAGAVK